MPQVSQWFSSSGQTPIVTGFTPTRSVSLAETSRDLSATFSELTGHPSPTDFRETEMTEPLLPTTGTLPSSVASSEVAPKTLTPVVSTPPLAIQTEATAVTAEVAPTKVAVAASEPQEQFQRQRHSCQL